MNNFTGQPRPLKVKIFKSGGPVYHYTNANARQPGLEARVNDFLAEDPERAIFHIKQSSAAVGEGENFESETTISIWYQD